jgi:predicted RNA-binding Zn ribbon-like protein
METPVEGSTALDGAPRPLPIVGGHLALDFANTVDDPNGPLRWDHIADYPALLDWCRRLGVVAAADAAHLADQADRHPGRAAAAVRRAAALRAALNEVFGAVVERRDTSTGWVDLRPFVVSAVERMDLSSADGHPEPGWEFADLESPLWPVAAAAHRLLGDPELARLKRCAACPWLFLDHSRNRSRRWCSMEDCGTHEKIRRYVNKRAGRPTD